MTTPSHTAQGHARWLSRGSRFSHDDPAGNERLCWDVCERIDESTIRYVCEVLRADDAQTIVDSLNGSAQLVEQVEGLSESLREMRQVCAALMRVVDETGAVDQMEVEFLVCGIKEGFGVRADEAIAKTEARAALNEVKL